jgi:hypothetical protein
MSPDEAAYEEGIDKLFREWEAEYAESFREEGRRDYELNRIVSYFKQAHFDQRIKDRMMESKSIQSTSPTGSLILSYSCIEIALRKELFAPIIYAFTTHDAVAEYFAYQIMRRDLLPKSITLLTSSLLENLVGLSVDAVAISGETKSLWNHINNIRHLRNTVTHNIELVGINTAANSLAIAEFIIRDVCAPLRRELAGWA